MRGVFIGRLERQTFGGASVCRGSPPFSPPLFLCISLLSDDAQKHGRATFTSRERALIHPQSHVKNQLEPRSCRSGARWAAVRVRDRLLLRWTSGSAAKCGDREVSVFRFQPPAQDLHQSQPLVPDSGGTRRSRPGEQSSRTHPFGTDVLISEDCGSGVRVRAPIQPFTSGGQLLSTLPSWTRIGPARTWSAASVPSEEGCGIVTGRRRGALLPAVCSNSLSHDAPLQSGKQKHGNKRGSCQNKPQQTGPPAVARLAPSATFHMASKRIEKELRDFWKGLLEGPSILLLSWSPGEWQPVGRSRRGPGRPCVWEEPSFFLPGDT